MMNLLRTGPAWISWGLTGIRGQISKFNTIEFLLFFIAGSSAEAAALPTAIGSVQVKWVYPKQTTFCNTTCISFPFSCLIKQAQTSRGFLLSPKQGVHTLNVLILYRIMAGWLGKYWTEVSFVTWCVRCRVSQKSLWIIPTDFHMKAEFTKNLLIPPALQARVRHYSERKHIHKTVKGCWV